MPLPDAFDLRLLSALQTDARTPMEALARSVGLSVPACYRRIRALRETGAIEREVAVVSPGVMGWPITMIVLVSLERDNGRIVDALIRKLRASEEVIDLWYVTGDHDLVVHIVARSMAHYDAFTQRVLHAEEDIRSFKTLVSLRQPVRAAPLVPPER